MQNVPIDLKIFLSSPYFLCHTVWISLTDSFQKEQKNINVAFSYGRLHWCGVISDGIDVYSIWQYSFPLIDQFTVSWHLLKVWGISAASLCCCTYAVLIAGGKKLSTGQICYLNYLSLSNPYPFLTHGAMA